MADPAAIPPGIGATSGPLLLGFLFNWGLYGVLSVQVYMYYLSFPKDKKFLKYLVLGVYLFETTQTILITHDAFASFGAGYGDLGQLGNVQLIWLDVPVFSGIMSATVQIFFAYRIKVLSQSRAIGIGIALLALTQGIAAIVQGVQAHNLGSLALLADHAFVSCTIWLAGSAVCDVIIAITMIYFLSKRDTGFKNTHDLVTKLMRLTIETGSLTATVATLDIILFLVFPHNDYHVAPALTLAKLYSNTMIVILNSRMRIVGGRNASAPQHELFSSSGHTQSTLQSRSVGSNKTLDPMSFRRDVHTWNDHTEMELGTMNSRATHSNSRANNGNFIDMHHGREEFSEEKSDKAILPLEV